jgi:hypothetical protein
MSPRSACGLRRGRSRPGLTLGKHLSDLRAPDDGALAVDLVPGFVAVSRGHDSLDLVIQ